MEEVAEATVTTYDTQVVSSVVGAMPSTPVTNSVVGPNTKLLWRAPVKMRSLDDLYDATEQGQYEYSGLCLLGAEEPATFKAVEREESWQCAMQEEMNSIRNNQTWILVNLPVGQRAIRPQWVYKVKKNLIGEVVKHKARLV